MDYLTGPKNVPRQSHSTEASCRQPDYQALQGTRKECWPKCTQRGTAAAPAGVRAGIVHHLLRHHHRHELTLRIQAY